MEEKKKGKKLFLCLRYDILEGIVKMYPFYVIEIVLLFLFCASAAVRFRGIMEQPGVLELSAVVFEGMEEYEYVKGGPGFQIPMTYFAFVLLSGIFAAYYPKREWSLRGNMYILRYRNKSIWWVSKCVWCALQMFLYYGIAFLVIWIFAGIGGNWGFGLRRETGMACLGLLNASAFQIFCYVYLLGAATAAAVNQMVVTLQMVVTPVLGYLCALAVAVASAYYFTSYLIGNNYMLLRTVLFREDGVGAGGAFVKVIVLWAVFVILGHIIIRKKDIL